MSKAAIEDLIAKPLIALLTTSSLREMSKTHLGQIFILDEDIFKETNLNAGLTLDEHNILWKTFKGKVLANEAKFIKTNEPRYKQCKAIIDNNNIANAHVVTKYSTVSDWKTQWAKEAAALLAKAADGRKIKQEDITGSTNSKGVQVGHGGDEIYRNSLATLAGVGAATFLASQLDNYSGPGLKSLRETILSGIMDRLSSEPLRAIRRTDLDITRSQFIDANGKLESSYVFVIDFQGAKRNQDEGKLESKALEDIETFIKTELSQIYSTVEGSTSLADAIEGVLDYTIKNSSKRAKIIGPKGKASYKSKTKVNKKIEQVVTSEVIKIPRAKKLNKTPVSVTKPSKVNIVALLNTKLPQEIRSRMTYPRLVNRTGRFSESVQVLSADTTRKGDTSFAYTYQKDPYQLFERGKSRLATPDREPRDIIDASIRSIAQEMMLGRFYTRRV